MFGNTEAKCVKKLGELRHDREKLESKAWSLSVEAAALASQTGEDALQGLLSEDADSGAHRAHSDRLAFVRAQLSGVPAARKALAQKVRESLKEFASIKSDALRSQAAKLQKEFESHTRRRDEALAALESLEGVPFVPDLQPRDCDGADLTTLIAADGAEAHEHIGYILAPRSVQLGQEIVRLQNEADLIDQNAARELHGGGVVAEDLAGLLRDVEDVTRLLPTRVQIENWFSVTDRRAAAEFEAKFPGGLFRPEADPFNRPPEALARVTRFAIKWDQDGNIDEHASNFTNRSVSAKAA